MAVATSSRRGARRGGTATPGVRHDRASVAAELAASSPAGFDTCARMESADRAVLKALDRR
jgi:hypothetical protein